MPARRRRSYGSMAVARVGPDSPLSGSGSSLYAETDLVEVRRDASGDKEESADQVGEGGVERGSGEREWCGGNLSIPS